MIHFPNLKKKTLFSIYGKQSLVHVRIKMQSQASSKYLAEEATAGNIESKQEISIKKKTIGSHCIKPSEKMIFNIENMLIYM